MKKDTRKVYNMQPIRLEGNVIHFDGKGNQEDKSLTIYRIYGDVTLYDQAIQDFCISNHYDTAKVLCMI